jgi:hypothetical protein
LAVSDAEYPVPTTPLGSGLLVIVRGAGLIVIVSPVVEAVWGVGVVESVTVMITDTALPGAVGVPPIAPVPVLIVSPAGRPVAE